MKAIVTRFHGPGNVRGARIIASDSDGNRVQQHCDDALTADQNHEKAARALCRKMGWTGVLNGGDLRPGQRVWVWVDLGMHTLAIVYP